jgi:RNA polymerase sigma-54 factor
MSLSLRLDVRQTQGLVMTPQLQQAIKLLQLSNLELQAFVERELEQNPFLEVAEDGGGRAEGDGAAPLEPSRPDALDGQPVIDGEATAGDGWSGASEDGWADTRAEALPNGLGIGRLEPVGRGGSTDFADEDDDVAGRLSRPKSLQEHLLEQLQLDLPDGPERMIGVHLIDLVDDAGYIRDDLGEVAARLGCSPEQVDAVLARLQQFDPAGVCARSLRECLALQLRDLGRLDPAMQALLDHLDLLAQLDLKGLVQVCGVLPDDLPEMIAELKALNPKPGLAFAHESAPPVVPDIFVYPVTGGAWRVELNSATLPRLLVNTAYYGEVAGRRHDKRDKEYLNERFQSANWLTKALDQRARTVLKVAEAVVARQLPFLARGVHHLRPLVLRDIAEATGLHESTVSRATADKYIATPRGNFPFKYFFSNALPGTAGEPSHAAEAIRQQIKVLIEREASQQVLSDDQIVEILRADGVAIARRTVAKYRESLGLPSSVQRRRTKALRLA